MSLASHFLFLFFFVFLFGFGLLGLLFFFTFFFFLRFTWAPASWAGRLGWFMIFGRGHELQSKGGPSFFIFLKIYLLKIFFFGVGVAQASLGPHLSPSLISCNKLNHNLFFFFGENKP